MDLAEPEEFSVFQAGYHPKDPLLFRKFQVILEPNNVVAGLHQIFLPKLNNSVRGAAGHRIVQTYRAHWAEAQRIDAPARELFNGKAGLEIASLFELLNCHGLG